MRPRSSTKRRVSKPEPLKRGLGQNERLGLLERDDVRRSREPVEESDLAEEVAGLQDANSLSTLVQRHEHFERAARDDEEAAIELTLANGELTGGVHACRIDAQA